MSNRLEVKVHALCAGKRIGILGFGREGQSTAAFLHQVLPDSTILIFDQNQVLPDKNSPHLQQATGYLERLNQVDILWKTPSVPLHTPELVEFVERGGVIATQLSVFLDVYRDLIIGVTGTKGKSTTSTLTAALLRATGARVVLGGNIGVPPFTLFDQAEQCNWIVLEMSSYQLESVSSSPHVAIMTSLFHEHLNFHQSYAAYAAAKANITKFQQSGDILIWNKRTPEFAQLAAEAQQRGVTTLPYDSAQWSERNKLLVPDAYAHINQIVLEQNVIPAWMAVEQVVQITSAQVEQCLSEFHSLPHRLHDMGVIGRYHLIDDSLATIPEAVAAAFHSLKKVDGVVLGGFDRGIEYELVGQVVVAHHPSLVMFFRPSGAKMWEEVQHELQQQQDQGKISFSLEKKDEQAWDVTLVAQGMAHTIYIRFVESMQDVANFAHQYLPVQSTVLLSPGSPSFGMFRDYVDKSHAFVEAFRTYEQP